MDGSVEELIAAPLLSSFRADGKPLCVQSPRNLDIQPSQDRSQIVGDVYVATKLALRTAQVFRLISDRQVLPLSLFLCLFHVGFNFSSSGREDVDVRTLGNGKTHLLLSHTLHLHTNFYLCATELKFVSKRSYMSCFCGFSGRPFALELLNPHRAKFNRTEIKQLQEVQAFYCSSVMCVNI